MHGEKNARQVEKYTKVRKCFSTWSALFSPNFPHIVLFRFKAKYKSSLKLNLDMDADPTKKKILGPDPVWKGSQLSTRRALAECGCNQCQESKKIKSFSFF
jgi:hypothetical protein